MGGIPIPAYCFLHRCQFWKVVDGKKVWRSTSNDQFYTWDSLHGEVEVFNKRGRHLGAMSPDGQYVKPPVRGRQIDV